MYSAKNTKKILVTGGAGYIGGHICKSLYSRGYLPVIYDWSEAPNPYVEKFGPYVKADINNTVQLAKVMEEQEISAVVHMAAFISVEESMKKPEAYYYNNVNGTLSVLNAMLAAGVSDIIFSSTAAVYGMPDNGRISEKSPVNPVNVYGRTKLICEGLIADMAAAHYMRFVNLRYFNAVGCDPEGEVGFLKPDPSNLVPIVLQAAEGRRKHVEIFGTDYDTADGTAMRDYIHVMDLAEAHISSLEYLKSDGRNETLNLGTGRGYTVKEVIEVARKITGKDITAVDASRRKGDPETVLAVADKAHEVLGWQAKYDLEDMIRTAWDWQRKLAYKVA